MRHLTLAFSLCMALAASGCVGPRMGGYGGCVDCGGLGPGMGGGPMQNLRMRMFQRDLARLHRRYPVLSASLGTGGCCACAPVISCDPCCGIPIDCGCSMPMDCGMPMSTCGAPTCGAPSCGVPLGPSCGAPLDPGYSTPTYAPGMMAPNPTPAAPVETSQYLAPPQPYSAMTPRPASTAPPLPALTGPALPAPATQPIQQANWSTTAAF